MQFSNYVVCVSERDVYLDNNLLRSALRTADILPALLFALHLHACTVCASEHDVY